MQYPSMSSQPELPMLAFDEDRCRIRRGHGPDNFALLRKIAVNLLKAEKTSETRYRRQAQARGVEP
jgi:predicted transposase YbfD/YdcC